MTADTLIYLHIPKTGGTTMMDILQANYGDGYRRVANYGQRESFWRDSDECKRTIRCLTGHLAFGVHRNLPQTAVYVTMVRFPLERVISLYTYIRSRPQHTSHKLAVFRTLADFVTERVVAGTENGMTRFLAGRAEFGIREAGDPVTRADYEQAIINVEKWFAFVGLTERYDASLAQMAALFGWQHLGYEAKLVQERPCVDDFDEQTVNVLRAHNQYDLMLYRHIQDKFWGELT